MQFTMNIRKLTNGAIFVQYCEKGKAKDAAFIGWPEFLDWLKNSVYGENW